MTGRLLKCKNCGFSQTEEAWLQTTREEKDPENYNKGFHSSEPLPEDSSSINPAWCPQCGKRRNLDNDLI